MEEKNKKKPIRVEEDKKIQIIDTTLRDGEQTHGVSFTLPEKLAITKYLLTNVSVDAVEVTSARISQNEFDTVKAITDWANKNNVLQKIEILGFVDNNKSSGWIYDAGGRVINLLCKGSLKHLELQLKKTKEEHISDIKKIIDFCKQKNITVNAYLEDWSNGMIYSKEYVNYLIQNLEKFGVNRIMLADTLGILNSKKTFEFVNELVKQFPNVNFDFHAHNDYDFAVANSIAAVNAGATRIHTTVNGLGERAGNTRLASFVAALNDLTEFCCNVKETQLREISKLVESTSGIKSQENTPIIGEHVFIQNCGVHADGDKKGNLYANKLTPERFGSRREYSLGKTAGIASIEKNLEELNLDISLDDSQKRKVLEKIKELAHKKQTISKEDLPFIIADVIDMQMQMQIELLEYDFKLNTKEKPNVKICLKINNEKICETASGDGQYDAFMNAIVKISKQFKLKLPKLVDYYIHIPPGGETSAIVETVIMWNDGRKTFKTKGVDCDQLLAAVEATIKMLNIVNMKESNNDK
jgi:D-citramalate synthase